MFLFSKHCVVLYAVLNVLIFFLALFFFSSHNTCFCGWKLSSCININVPPTSFPKCKKWQGKKATNKTGSFFRNQRNSREKKLLKKKTGQDTDTETADYLVTFRQGWIMPLCVVLSLMVFYQSSLSDSGLKSSWKCVSHSTGTLQGI